MATQHDLEASFTQEEGPMCLGGIEALVRLTLCQVRAPDGRRGFRP